MPGWFLPLVPIQNPCSICSKHLFSRTMILTMQSCCFILPIPGLILPMISSFFFSNAMKASTAEWKLIWILWRVTQISLSVKWSFSFSLDILYFMMVIISSWEMSHALHTIESCWHFSKTRKEHTRYVGQSKFVKHQWSLSKRIFVMLTFFIKEGIVNPIKEVRLSFLKCFE